MSSEGDSESKKKCVLWAMLAAEKTAAIEGLRAKERTSCLVVEFSWSEPEQQAG